MPTNARAPPLSSNRALQSSRCSFATPVPKCCLSLTPASASNWHLGPTTALSVLYVNGYAVAAFVWARFRIAQAERHLAIVDPLLVTRLPAEPLLRVIEVHQRPSCGNPAHS